MSLEYAAYMRIHASGSNSVILRIFLSETETTFQEYTPTLPGCQLRNKGKPEIPRVP